MKVEFYENGRKKAEYIGVQAPTCGDTVYMDNERYTVDDVAIQLDRQSGDYKVLPTAHVTLIQE